MKSDLYNLKVQNPGQSQKQRKQARNDIAVMLHVFDILVCFFNAKYIDDMSKRFTDITLALSSDSDSTIIHSQEYIQACCHFKDADNGEQTTITFTS